ncbi:MAG: hypothetical protein M0Z63_09415 [Actinomycetota bacterium]|nr:hypothetical protein [Actinomycetota bacterium]
MTARPQQPEPFVRGWVFAPAGTVAYPRLHPQESDQVPGDVWSAATLPVGVRIEVVGDATAVRLRYRTTTADLGYRGDGAGCTFVVFRSGRRIAEAPAVLGDGEVVLPLVGDPDQPAVIYLPEGMRPVVHQIQPVDGSLRPAPRQPRCLIYGDAVTQGWLASSPVGSWSTVVGRTLGLDVCNMGYAGTTRLEPAVAQMMARTPAEAVVVAVGTGCWSKPPHSTALLVEELRSFLQLVRAGHARVPLVVMSPTCRPAAEDTPNVFGATLTDLRRAVEDVVTDLATSDNRLALIDGSAVLGPEELADGTYPDDEGHKRIAAAVRKVLVPRGEEMRQAAVARWQEEMLANTPAYAHMVQAPKPPVPARAKASGPATAVPVGPGPAPDVVAGVADASGPVIAAPVGPDPAAGPATPAGPAAPIAGPAGPAPAPAPVSVAPRPPGEPVRGGAGPGGAAAGRRSGDDPVGPTSGDGNDRASEPGDLSDVPEAIAAAARVTAAAAEAYAAATTRGLVLGAVPA